jgi:NADPH:quinone reductase-like Zn-dependent oxidoreductase
MMEVAPHFNSNPWIPGWEFSGFVVASGENTLGEILSEGREVFGMVNPKKYNKYNGTLAEYIIVPRDGVTQKPSNISLEDATAATVGCAVVGIAEKADLLEVYHISGEYGIRSKAEGKKVLVTGGSTNTGLATLQLVRALVGPKGKIVTTCSPRNFDAVRSQGADEVSADFQPSCELI